MHLILHWNHKYKFSNSDLDTSGQTVSFSSALTKAMSDKGNRKRFNHSNDVIGYYGGAEAESVSVESLHEPEISVTNGDQLKVEVTLNAADADRDDIDSVQLIVTLGNKKKILQGQFPQTASFDATGKKIPGKCTFILDDVTSDVLKFTKQFSNVLTDSESTYQLGQDILVQAVVLPKGATVDGSGKIASAGWSEEETVNPLFASVTKDNDNYTASISSFRHLINLQTLNDFTNSKLSVTAAEQISDIDWASFLADGSVSGTTYIYTPLSLNHDLIYNGKYYRITDLKIGSTDSSISAAGLFGSVKNKLTLKQMVLDDFNVSGTNAGALAGEVTDSGELTVDSVIARGYQDANTIYGSENAGGLIGKAAGNVSMTYSSASVYVKGGSAAGGLIGSLSNGTVSKSYVGGHTNDGKYTENITSDSGKGRMNVQSENGNAGGLIGTLTGGLVEYSYSNASVYGSTAGSVVGFADKTDSVANVYGSGLIKNGSSKGKEGPAIGSFETYQAIKYQAADSSKPVAYPYDNALWNSEEISGSVYNFPSINDLSGETSSVWFINNPIGDWAKVESDDKLYYVDYYIAGTDDPYVDDPQINNPVTIGDKKYNRVPVKEKGSAPIPTNAATGYYVKNITYVLADDNGEFSDTSTVYTYDMTTGKCYSDYDKGIEADSNDTLNEIHHNVRVYVEVQPGDNVPANYVMLKYALYDNDVEKDQGNIGRVKLDSNRCFTYNISSRLVPNYQFDGWYTLDGKSLGNGNGPISSGEVKTVIARYKRNQFIELTLSETYQSVDGQKLSGTNITGGRNFVVTPLGQTITENYTLADISNGTVTAAEIYENGELTWKKNTSGEWETSADNAETKIVNLTNSNGNTTFQAVTNKTWNITVVLTGTLSKYTVTHVFEQSTQNNDAVVKDENGNVSGVDTSVLPYNDGENAECAIEQTLSGVSGQMTQAVAFSNIDGFEVDGDIQQSPISADGNTTARGRG